MPSYIIVSSRPYSEYTGPMNTHPLASRSRWVLDSLAKNVNALLKEGWVCTGGIQVVSHEGMISAALQSMVKND